MDLKINKWTLSKHPVKMSWALGPGPLARPVPSGPLGPDPGPMGPWDPGPCPDPGTYKLFASPRSSPRGEFIFRKRTFWTKPYKLFASPRSSPRGEFIFRKSNFLAMHGGRRTAEEPPIPDPTPIPNASRKNISPFGVNPSLWLEVKIVLLCVQTCVD